MSFGATGLTTLDCPSCGGAIAMLAGRSEPKCLFCGREGLVPRPLPEGVDPPEAWMPFSVGEAAARERFGEFAKSSFWYPSNLATSELELRALFLPAWIWGASIETHWVALVRAPTKSRLQPRTGSAHRRIDGVLVPSSPALTAAELASLSPFEEGDEQPFAPECLPAPFEIGDLTRSVARREAHRRMSALEDARLKDEVDARRLRTSRLIHEDDGRPVLLPVWIGAYRRGDRLYRVLVNGQTGVLRGTAPISIPKVVATIASVVLAIVLFIGWFLG